MDVLHVSLHILFLLKHLATNFTRELCHLESSDEDSQEDDDIEKYNPEELIGDISDDGDNHDDGKHEKPKSSDKTDLKGTSDLENCVISLIHWRRCVFSCSSLEKSM
jgi:hypothetical protein